MTDELDETASFLLDPAAPDFAKAIYRQNARHHRESRQDFLHLSERVVIIEERIDKHEAEAAISRERVFGDQGIDNRLKVVETKVGTVVETENERRGMAKMVGLLAAGGVLASWKSIWAVIASWFQIGHK